MTRWQKMTQEQKESANERRRLWKLKNPEKAKALGRRLAARHYYKNISESRRKNRESQARQRLLNPDLQKIVNEINKCEVRCANCHAVRTWAHKLPEREKE